MLECSFGSCEDIVCLKMVEFVLICKVMYGAVSFFTSPELGQFGKQSCQIFWADLLFSPPP